MSNYDKVYINGEIFTLDESNPYGDAMAIKNGKVLWVGQEKDFNIDGEIVENLKGKRVLPSFVDSHMHPIMLADNMRQITCLPPFINSIDEIIEGIKKEVPNQKSGGWILGWGYDESKLAENRTPTRYDLDKGTTEFPVCLIRSCQHIRCVNSKALQLAGITKDTPDPPGGEIVKDAHGEPTGELRENARNLIMHLIPKATEDELVDDLVKLSQVLFSQGITSITDMCEMSPVDYYDIFLKASKKGFKQRVSIYYLWELFKDKEGFKIDPQKTSRDIKVRVAGIKLLGDGGISGRTAWVDRPYINTNNERGMAVCSEKDIRDAIKYCKANNLQLSIHAMGACAIDRAVNIAYEEKNWLTDDIPSVRIEHASMPTENALRKAAKGEIAFNTQPLFLYAEIDSYLANMGKEWLHTTFPINDILDAGVHLCISTDAPATPWAAASDPKYCLKGAVTRKAYNGIDCGQKHKIDIKKALKLYIADAVPVMGFRNIGKLKAGYEADFIILDRDILAIPADDIDKIKVEATYMGGERVF